MTHRLSLSGTALGGALALLTALGGGTAALARTETCVVRGNHVTYCQPGRRVGQRDRHAPPPPRVVIVAPRVGERIHGGEVVEYRRYPRLPPPPPRQEYRVYDKRVVRVDSQTLQVLAVVGLASALLNGH